MESLEGRAMLTASVAGYGDDSLLTLSTSSGPDSNQHNFQVGEAVQLQVVRADGLAGALPGNRPRQVPDGVGGSTACVDGSGIRNAHDLDNAANGMITTEWAGAGDYANSRLPFFTHGFCRRAFFFNHSTSIFRRPICS